MNLTRLAAGSLLFAIPLALGASATTAGGRSGSGTHSLTVGELAGTALFGAGGGILGGGLVAEVSGATGSSRLALQLIFGGLFTGAALGAALINDN